MHHPAPPEFSPPDSPPEPSPSFLAVQQGCKSPDCSLELGRESASRFEKVETVCCCCKQAAHKRKRSVLEVLSAYFLPQKGTKDTKQNNCFCAFVPLCG